MSTSFTMHEQTIVLTVTDKSRGQGPLFDVRLARLMEIARGSLQLEITDNKTTNQPRHDWRESITTKSAPPAEKSNV